MCSECMTTWTFACAHYKIFFLCSTQISLKNIWYDVCFDNTDSLPGDDDDGDDDDDTGAISTCGLEATDDVVAEIYRKQVIWQCYNVSSIFWNLIVYTFISWCCSLRFFNNCLCMPKVSKLISFVGKFNIMIYII